MSEQLRCPVPHGTRRTSRGDDSARPAVELVDGTWHVRSHDAVRHALRSGAVTQAGFAVDTARRHRPDSRPPVLFADGEEHRAQRRAIARYFAPVTVDRRYRGLMQERADALVGDIARRGRVDLPAVTMRYAVDVASRVVGLTNSDTDAMARRLSRFFELTPPEAQPRSRFAKLLAVMRGARLVTPLLRFQRLDVAPAIAARREQPGEDVISHLIASGYSDEEILLECVTYGAAGMVTTREFIAMATWHLLGDEAARTAYLGGDEAERYRILAEILRLEPVVGHLYRRTTESLTLPTPTGEITIGAGERLDLYLRAANADEDAVGPDPLTLCPGREVAAGVRAEAMSFGDGAHRCPGNALAIQESDIFLTRLLALPLRLVSTPRIEWDELISGYAVRDLVLEVTPGP